MTDTGRRRRPPVVRRSTPHATDRRRSRPRLDVHDPRVYERVLRQGSVGLGESYADGWWDADDLDRASCASRSATSGRTHARRDRIHRRVTPVVDPGAAAPPSRSRPRRPPRARALRPRQRLLRRDCSTRRWPTPARSSTVPASRWPTRRAPSSTGSRALLDLRPGDRLLEIGTGWAGFALHAAQRVRVPSSRPPRSRPRQYEHARTRVAAAGLERPRHGARRRLPRPARHLRQGDRDRDDRGRRLARLPDVLRARPRRS